jgi:nitrogen fixation-related uncharacterized protein
MYFNINEIRVSYNITNLFKMFIFLRTLTSRNFDDLQDAVNRILFSQN